MDVRKFEDLPCDIVELICTYLEYYDIAKLEQSSMKILLTILKLNLWRKVAITWIKEYDVPAAQYALQYMKENAGTCPKVCKILIGVTVQTMKSLDDVKRLLNDYESLYIKPLRLMVLRQDETYHSHDALMKILGLWEKIRRLRSITVNKILNGYNVKIKIINKLKVVREVEDMIKELSLDKYLSLDKDLSLDVMNHISGFKHQTSRILMLLNKSLSDK